MPSGPVVAHISLLAHMEWWQWHNLSVVGNSIHIRASSGPTKAYMAQFWERQRSHGPHTVNSHKNQLDVCGPEVAQMTFATARTEPNVS